jgi:protein transport protein SEC61 subunit alpha
VNDVSGRAAPIDGLAYYISPPRNFIDIQTDPLHALFYYFFVMSSCAFISRLWIDNTGQSAKDIMKQLMDQDLMIEDWREQSMVEKL